MNVSRHMYIRRIKKHTRNSRKCRSHTRRISGMKNDAKIQTALPIQSPEFTASMFCCALAMLDMPSVVVVVVYENDVLKKTVYAKTERVAATENIGSMPGRGFEIYQRSLAGELFFFLWLRPFLQPFRSLRRQQEFQVLICIADMSVTAEDAPHKPVSIISSL